VHNPLLTVLPTMDRFMMLPTAIESSAGSFIDITAVDILRDTQNILTEVKRGFEDTLCILQSREALTVVSILNLAECITQEFGEPELFGKRYDMNVESVIPDSDGKLVRIEDAKHLRNACLLLFEDCEALQNAIRSEVHQSRHAYVFTWRTDQP